MTSAAVIVTTPDELARVVESAVSRALGGLAPPAPPVADDGPAILDQVALGRLLGISVREVQRRRKDGRIPRGTAIGPRSVRWVRADVLAWLRAGAPPAEAVRRRRG